LRAQKHDERSRKESGIPSHRSSDPTTRQHGQVSVCHHSEDGIELFNIATVQWSPKGSTAYANAVLGFHPHNKCGRQKSKSSSQQSCISPHPIASTTRQIRYDIGQNCDEIVVIAMISSISASLRTKINLTFHS